MSAKVTGMGARAFGLRVWAAAEALEGARFRLQGRDAATGLDCIGLVLAAYAQAGVLLRAIDNYRLRGAAVADVLDGLDACGLMRCAAPIAAGDVGLFLLPARQLHLALMAPEEIIHADAGLRRVARAPLARLPAVTARWRWTRED